MKSIITLLIKINGLHPLFQPQGNRWHGNLFLLCELILKQCGVTAIYCDYLCTFKDQQRFYSYRRDAGVTGRMASLIWISS